MQDFSMFLNKYVFLDYSPVHHFLYSMINKVENDEIYLIVSSDFEKTGLLIDDELNCKIQEGKSEYSFKAKITGIDIRSEGLILIITPISEVQQFIDIRSSKRINLRIIAFINDVVPTSVLNVSKKGILISSKNDYKENENIDVKILISYPTVICSFSGKIIRVKETVDDRKEYGLEIEKFKSDDDERRYKRFISDLTKAAEIND